MYQDTMFQRLPDVNLTAMPVALPVTYDAQADDALSPLAITMFGGVSILAYHFAVVPSDTETVVSQLARGIFGGRNSWYYMVQFATTLILVLAANTAFARAREILGSEANKNPGP